MKFVIVDDDEFVLKLMKMVLEEGGLRATGHLPHGAALPDPVGDPSPEPA